MGEHGEQEEVGSWEMGEKMQKGKNWQLQEPVKHLADLFGHVWFSVTCCVTKDHKFIFPQLRHRSVG